MRLLKNLMAKAVQGVLKSMRDLAGTEHPVRNIYFRGGSLGLAIALILGVRLVQLGATPATRFTHLSVEQGLSQSTVEAILQDHAGFLWFGTEEGLNRYDGYTFLVFKNDPRDPKSITDNVVSALFEDRRQRLWVGTEHGLCLFDRQTETFTRVPAILDRVTSIVEGLDGTVWVGAEGGGLFLLRPSANAFVSYQPDPRKPSSLASFRVSALLRDHSGRLWIGTRDGGVDLFQEGNSPARFVHHRHDARDPGSLANDEVWGLAEDAAGNIWVATYGGGLNVLDHQTGVFRHYRHRPGDPHSLRTDLVTCMFVDRIGTIWAGTDRGGVQQYDPTSDGFLAIVHNAADPASLSQDVVRSIYEDVQGQLWVGTFLGGANLLKKPRRAFGYFTHDPMDSSSLSDPAVACFLEDTEGRIWLGTEEGWLNRLEQQKGTFVRYRFPSSLPGGAAILSLHQDRRGRIWVGSYEGGMARFDPRSGSFVVYKHRSSDPSSLTNDEVWAIAEDDVGTLWLATNGGLDRFDPDAAAVTAHFDTLSADGLTIAGARAVLYDREGNLWVGSIGGLNLLRHGSSTFVRYRHDEHDPRTLSHDSVMALHEDREGRIWVGTLGGGLNRLDPATGVFTPSKEFPSNVIYGIEEESSGRLWLSTNHGLSRLDAATGMVENFDLSNGLQSVQFHPGASLRTKSGRLLFGSVDGFYNFDPEAIKPDIYAPPVVLTSLRIFNEPVKLPKALSVADEIKLAPGDKVFSFEFAALDYTVPRRNRYAYLMQGFSDKWIELGGKRDVTFTNLDPGTYVLRIKASNSDGGWSKASAVALRVIVRPPFWRTWWFYTLCILGTVFTGSSAYRLRTKRLRVRSQTLTKLVDERTRELAMERAFLRQVLDMNPSLIFAKDRAGRFTLANKAIADLLHTTVDDLIGKTDADFNLHAKEVEKFRRDDLEVMDTLQEKVIPEEPSTDAAGNLHWMQTVKRPIVDEEGKADQVLGVATDITERKRVEEEIRRREADYRRLVEDMPEVVWRTDVQGNILFISEKIREVFGYPLEELGRAGERLWFGRMHADDRERVRKAYAKLFSENQPFDVEYRIQHRDGHWMWWHDRGATLGGRPGRRYAEGLLSDITERKQAEQELRRYKEGLEEQVAERTAELTETNEQLRREIAERKRAEEALRLSEARYRSLVENQEYVVFRLDLQGILAYVSPAIEGVADYRTDEVIGKPFWDFVYPEDLPRLQTSLAQTMAGSKEPFEFRVVDRDGSLRWVRTSSRIEFDGGSPVGLTGILADITDRKRAEEAQREAEQKYRTIVEEAIVGIFQSAPSGRYLSVNPAMARMFGYDSPQELMASITNISEQVYVDPKRREEFTLSLEQQGAVQNFECQVYRKDGSKIWISTNARAISRDGVVVCYEGTNEDITERKLLEEQLRQAQKMESIGTLSGGIAHDFNNLLTIIKGYSRMVLDEAQDKKIQSHIERIDEATERAAALTSQLLAFSRRQVLQPKIFDLNSLVLDLDKMLQRLIGEDIEMVTIAASDLGAVKADPGQIEQVIMNLAVNARDAMPNGGKLILETSNVELDEAYAREHVGVRPGRYVMFAVSDTGIGMDSETQARMFEPFFTTKEVGKGTGLGLSMVYGIVKQSGGNIWVYTEPGRGTTFKVYLPRVDAPAEMVVGRPPTGASTRGNETILLVEDDSGVRELARAVLAASGYSVLVAGHASVAASLCEQHPAPIDLLLTDVVMPGLGGRELARQVLARRPGIKVLYMSGYTTNAIVHHGELDAGTFFLPKPFTPETLTRKVREVLDHLE